MKTSESLLDFLLVRSFAAGQRAPSSLRFAMLADTQEAYDAKDAGSLFPEALACRLSAGSVREEAY